STSGCVGKCAAMVREQLQIMIDRATERGEASPTADDLIDAIVAPMIYRILYSEAAPTLKRVHQWVNRCLG
ncbi:transcriptional regulator, partial [Pseudomonas syringae pv. actinidiae ICMP 18807]